MTEPSKIHATLAAYFAGINGEDYESVGRLFAEDGELRAPGTKPRKGPEGVATYFEDALAPYPEHHDEPTRVLVSGSSATVEITFNGITAEGAPLNFDAVDVFDFDDEGRVLLLTSWYDSYVVRATLKAARAGVNPPDRSSEH